MPSSEYDVLFRMIVIQTDTIKELGIIVDHLQKDNKDLQEQIKATNDRMTDLTGILHSKMLEHTTNNLNLIVQMRKEICALKEVLRNKH